MDLIDPWGTIARPLPKTARLLAKLRGYQLLIAILFFYAFFMEE